MPASIFSDAELERLASFPDEIPQPDLIRAFTLTGPDRDLAQSRRRPANRLGLALQLCAVRYLGFVPRSLESAPASAIRFIAAQLQVDPEEIQAYAARPQTRREHLASVREHLGFKSPGSSDLTDLEAWLTERALEHDAPRLLFRLARQRLRSQRIVSPAPDRIVRIISSGRARAQEKTFALIEHLLTDERRKELDELLEAKDSSSRSILKWLDQGSTGESPQSIKGEVEKLLFLRKLGADKWDLSQLTPNRRKFLAQVGRRATGQTLRRMPEMRRYPILIALLHETTIDLVDEIVDLFDRALRKADSRSRRELDEWKVRTARATNEKVRLFSRIGHLVLDPTIPDHLLRQRIFEEVASEDRFATAVAESDQLLRPRDDSHLDFVENRYNHLRKFAPIVLEALPFRALTHGDPLIDAVEVLKEMNRTRRRKVPDVTELEFLPKKWRNQVVGSEGQVKRRPFELCVLYQLREGLRSGDIWIPGSRRYANPSTYLLPPEKWDSERVETLRLLELDPEAGPHLQDLVTTTEAAIQRLDEVGLSESDSLRVEEGRIVLSPSAASELPEEVLRLNSLVAERLPRVQLAEVLSEVDSWTGFSRSFRHAGGARSRTPDLVSHVYAAIVAQAWPSDPEDVFWGHLTHVF